MNITNSKKQIMAIAALLILIFHQWIPIFGSGSIKQIERFIITVSYIGVDMFFFVSACTLAKKPPENYKGFIIDRSIKLLPLFIIALVFNRFLWFIPAIMVMYLLFPPIFKLSKKAPFKALAFIILGWAALVAIVQRSESLHSLGIFIFRIPVIILGAYLSMADQKISKRGRLAAGIFLSIIGVMISVKYGYLNKIMLPFNGAFYLSGIPLTIGLILIIDFASEFFRPKALEFLGNISLELYFSQMLIGRIAVETALRLTGNKLLTNLISFSAAILFAYLVKALTNLILRKGKLQSGKEVKVF